MTEAASDYMKALGIFAVPALFALTVTIHPTPWSPMGQFHQEQSQERKAPTVDLSDFDIPEGWAPGDDGTRIIVPRVPTTEA
jgi:hypothetical protein